MTAEPDRRRSCTSSRRAHQPPPPLICLLGPRAADTASRVSRPNQKKSLTRTGNVGHGPRRAECLQTRKNRMFSGSLRASGQSRIIKPQEATAWIALPRCNSDSFGSPEDFTRVCKSDGRSRGSCVEQKSDSRSDESDGSKAFRGTDDFRRSLPYSVTHQFTV